MTVSVSLARDDDPLSYSTHPEDNMPETDSHEYSVRYLRGAVASASEEWRVSGNVCIYWERGNYQRYVAPDLFVLQEPRSTPGRRVVLAWQEPPILFALEVISRTTRKLDEEEKPALCAEHLRIPEFLLYDPERHTLRTGRLGPNGYDPVLPGPNGRSRSVSLGLEFGLGENGFLWVYDQNGERIPLQEELHQALTLAEERLETTAKRLATEAQGRRRERQRREEAEARANAEAARREELERQLAELRARLGERGD